MSVKDKLPRDLAYDKDYEEDYNNLTGRGRQPFKDSPFLGKTNRDIFLYSMALGFFHKRRTKLKNRRDNIRSDALHVDGEWLVYSIAISEKKDLNVLLNMNEVAHIAEEYSNGGFPFLKDLIQPGSFADPERRLASDIRKILISIETGLTKHEKQKTSYNSINDLIKNREDSNLEFKSSLIYDIQVQRENKILGKLVAKTVAAFMNSNGGRLLIGVSDQGEVLGLENDYKYLEASHQDSDGFEIYLRQCIFSYSRNKIANEYFKVRFHQTDGKEICEVIVSPAPKPVFVYDQNGKVQECYVRIGNSSIPYSADEFFEYCNRHFH